MNFLIFGETHSENTCITLELALSHASFSKRFIDASHAPVTNVLSVVDSWSLAISLSFWNLEFDASSCWTGDDAVLASPLGLAVWDVASLALKSAHDLSVLLLAVLVDTVLDFAWSSLALVDDFLDWWWWWWLGNTGNF